MPRYLIIRRVAGSNKCFLVGYTESMRSIRSAWGWFKKNHKRKIRKGFEYHLFAMNHARFWSLEGKKWKISSWYQNHKNNKQ